MIDTERRKSIPFQPGVVVVVVDVKLGVVVNMVAAEVVVIVGSLA